MARTLQGQRILVVGASAGIGREFALRAIADGAKVIVAARRTGLLDELVDEAGGGLPVALDIRDDASCAALADQIRAAYESVDLIVVSAGYSPLSLFPDLTVEGWQRVLDVNVIGIHQLIRNLLPVCSPGALVAVMSTESVMQPRHALGAYAASKAALELSLQVWRQEVPAVRFTTLVIGGTFPTDFAADFDADILVPAMETWARHGVVQEKLMTPQEVADVLIGTLASIVDLPDVSIDRLVVRSASPVVGGAEHLQADAAENARRS